MPVNACVPRFDFVGNAMRESVLEEMGAGASFEADLRDAAALALLFQSRFSSSRKEKHGRMIPYQLQRAYSVTATGLDQSRSSSV